jgi:hypothetical protein
MAVPHASGESNGSDSSTQRNAGRGIHLAYSAGRIPVSRIGLRQPVRIAGDGRLVVLGRRGGALGDWMPWARALCKLLAGRPKLR